MKIASKGDVIFWLYIIILTVCIFGCTNVTLNNGKSTATFKGMKIFSPTVLSLQDGNCQVPSVDAGGTITQTPIVTTSLAASTTESCHTAIMTVNGVDLKGFANILMTAILGAIAAS